MIVPPHVLEAANGVLWPTLMFAAIGAGWWLGASARQIGSLRQLYLEEKASIALLVAFGGLGVRTSSIWVVQHLRDHGNIVPEWSGWSTVVYVVSTAVSVIGVMCWLRCTLPEAFGWRGWAVLTAMAFAFGILMAL